MKPVKADRNFDLFKHNLFAKLLFGLAIFLLLVLALFYAASVAGISFLKLNNDKVLVRNDEVLARSNLPALQAARVQQLTEMPVVNAGDLVTGPANAVVTLVVYYDFDCPFSARLHPVLKQALGVYGDKLRIVWRNFPLISHPIAPAAANAFLCAGEQGKYLEMADKLFVLQAGEQMSESYFKIAATELSLDLVKYDTCVTSSITTAKVDEQKKAAEGAGVVGTPQLFLNGQSYPGAWQWDDFSDASGLKRQGLKSLIDKIVNNR